MAFTDPESQRAFLKKAATYGTLGLAAAALAPIALWMVQGLIAWAALGIAFLVIANFAPAVGDWFANMRIKALVAIAEANPIETMQALYTEKSSELNRQAEAVRDFETEYRNVRDLVKGLEKTDPEEAVEYAQMAAQMGESLEALKTEQNFASEALTDFSKQIDKARRIYKVAQAMNKALESSQSAQAKVFAEIKEKVAFDKVRTDLNRAFANLNMAVERRRQNALPTVEVKQIDAPQLEADLTPQRDKLRIVK